MFEIPDDRPVSRSVVQVRSYELDSFGHTNHAVYLNYLEFARFETLSNVGFPYQDIVARGWAIYVVRIEVDYVKEARLGDALVVHTWSDGFRRTSMTLVQRISRLDDPSTVVAQARVTAVWVGQDRRPMRVPMEIREVLGARGRSTLGVPPDPLP